MYTSTITFTEYEFLKLKISVFKKSSQSLDSILVWFKFGSHGFRMKMCTHFSSQSCLLIA